MRFQQIAGLALLSVVITAMISCGVQLCHGETTGPEKSVASLTVKENPNVALVGSLISGTGLRDDDGRVATAIRIHPPAMYALYDEGIVFCGDESARVTENDGRSLRRGTLVFIYRRAAARLILGVPCYELKAVLEIKIEGKK